MARTTKSQKTVLRWTLTFESGIKVARPTFARIVSGIENLQSEGDGNNWLILETTREEGSIAGFMQFSRSADSSPNWVQSRSRSLRSFSNSGFEPRV